MDVADRRNRITVKKLNMNSPDFHEENMCLTEGTPKECWDTFWNFMAATAKFFGNEDIKKPLRRDVIRKTNWAEIMEEERSAWAH